MIYKSKAAAEQSLVGLYDKRDRKKKKKRRDDETRARNDPTGPMKARGWAYRASRHRIPSSRPRRNSEWRPSARW